MKLKIKAMSPKMGNEIPLPFYASPGAAAMDLCACMDEAVTIAPGEIVSLPAGVAIALPSAEYAALVFARSGLGIKHGIALANGVGVSPRPPIRCGPGTGSPSWRWCRWYGRPWRWRTPWRTRTGETAASAPPGGNRRGRFLWN